MNRARPSTTVEVGDHHVRHREVGRTGSEDRSDHRSNHRERTPGSKGGVGAVDEPQRTESTVFDGVGHDDDARDSAHISHEQYHVDQDRDRDADILNAGFSTLRITDHRLKHHATHEAERLKDILRSRS